MLRYLALVWNPADPEQSALAQRLFQQFEARSPKWQSVTAAPGLAVSAHIEEHPDANEIYRLSREHGVVLGKLFERSYDGQDIPARLTLDEKRTGAIVQSAGQELIERYWGGYVAFVREGGSRRIWVLRDPTGIVPCYSTCVQGVQVYFRALEDCERLAPLSLSVNRRFLICMLAFGFCLSRITALNEVSKVLAGERIEHAGAQHTRDFCWNPLKVADTDVIEDPEQAERLTRSTVRSCVHAWASCYESIVLSLSGGIDSSIVLACLRDAPSRPRLVCETLYTDALDEDERQYARLIAERAGVELIEQKMIWDYRFDMPEHMPRTVMPFHWDGYEAFRARIAQLERQCGPSALFTGRFGDELFFKRGHLPTAADHVYRHGLTRAGLRVALEDARVDGVALWRVLRRAITHGVLKRPWSLRENFRKTSSALIPQAVAEEALNEQVLLHPLYTAAIAGPPGKIYHASLMSMQADRLHAPSALGAPLSLFTVDPLSSQPFIELSLRTPLYVLRAGGRDRAIARRAFASALPPQITRRRWKGRGESVRREGLERNLDKARVLLQKGWLVQHGYLDHDKVREALEPAQPTRLSVPIADLLNCLDIEIWCSSGWYASSHAAAA